MILEGIVTTRNGDGSSNISPMGPVVDNKMESLELRPYKTSTTYGNLRRNGQGVFHVTDDVHLLARAAVGRILPPPRLIASSTIRGDILADACRWYAFRVLSLDDHEPRTRIRCEVVDQGRIRDFVGFNRAKHAVLEAAILATRIEFLPVDQIDAEFKRLSVIVEKTAGPQEKDAFAFLQDYVLGHRHFA